MEPRLIYETVHGSRAYGLAREGSDEDRRGVIVGPRAWYFGLVGGPEQIARSDDDVWLEIRKLMRLAVAANPSMLEILFTDARHHRVLTSEGAMLLDARERFLSKRVETTFAGYALAQLARIRTHRRWLLAPPRIEPTRSAFGLPERSTIPRDQMGALETLMARGDLDDAALPENFLDVLAREKRYRAARREWEQHRQWQRERNPKRAALEAAHGYDTKHAMHLVRLMRMAIEVLETGRLLVERSDRDELLAIRDGAWSYESLEAACEKLRSQIAAAASTSKLPEVPDEPALDALCVEIVERALTRKD
jgi:predicted nucleotidyltransferase